VKKRGSREKEDESSRIKEKREIQACRRLGFAKESRKLQV